VSTQRPLTEPNLATRTAQPPAQAVRPERLSLSLSLTHSLSLSLPLSLPLSLSLSLSPTWQARFAGRRAHFTQAACRRAGGLCHACQARMGQPNNPRSVVRDSNRRTSCWHGGACTVRAVQHWHCILFITQHIAGRRI
jgi:hypothetical protein